MNGADDLSGVINKLTENPEMMKSLMGIAGKLMKSGNSDDGPHDDKHSRRDDCEGGKCHEDGSCTFSCGEDGKNDRSRKEECCDGGGKRGRLGGDAENLIRLLIALKPYVGRERCEKIDGIVKILKLVQLSEKTGLLKSLL